MTFNNQQVASSTYDQGNRATARTLGNGVTVNYGYNNDNTLSGITTTGSGENSGSGPEQGKDILL